MPTQRTETPQLPIPNLNQPRSAHSRPMQEAAVLERTGLFDSNVKAETRVCDEYPRVFLCGFPEKPVEDVRGGEAVDGFGFAAGGAGVAVCCFGVGGAGGGGGGGGGGG